MRDTTIHIIRSSLLAALHVHKHQLLDNVIIITCYHVDRYVMSCQFMKGDISRKTRDFSAMIFPHSQAQNMICMTNVLVPSTSPLKMTNLSDNRQKWNMWNVKGSQKEHRGYLSTKSISLAQFQQPITLHEALQSFFCLGERVWRPNSMSLYSDLQNEQSNMKETKQTQSPNIITLFSAWKFDGTIAVF